ncbi:MAG: rhomboid family intramembrane serine protease [Ignavibacteriales bacterium]|nr:rhomboid family intramembrane serine protease [Ignavibacteriales bacterium]
MIPLRDTNPSNTFPIVNYSIIAVNVVVFFYELSLGAELGQMFLLLGVVPQKFSADIQTLNIDLGTIQPFFTSMFLHGGWMHLIGNMLFLYVFGDNIEDKFGKGKYILFYFFCGFAAALTQVYINPESHIPMIGASGAIAGVLGAYVVMFPKARVFAVVPMIIFYRAMELPAFLFLGFWFLMQVISGMLSLGIGGDAGGVAFWAHIGGFVCGVALVPLLKKQ